MKVNDLSNCLYCKKQLKYGTDYISCLGCNYTFIDKDWYRAKFYKDNKLYYLMALLSYDNVAGYTSLYDSLDASLIVRVEYFIELNKVDYSKSIMDVGCRLLKLKSFI